MLKKITAFLLILTINFFHLATPALVLAEELSSNQTQETSDTPNSTSTPQPTETTTPTSTPQPSGEPQPTASPTPQPSTIPTPSPDPSNEASPSATPTLNPTPTPVATSSAIPSATPTATISANLKRVSDKEAGISRDQFTDHIIIVKYKKERVNIRRFDGQLKASFFQLKHDLNKVDEVKDINIQIHTTEKPVLEKIDELKKDPDVEYAEPNYIRYPRYTPNDPSFNKLWGLHNFGQDISLTSGIGFTGTVDADIDAPEAWDLESSNQPDVIAAVLDSGVAYNHVDLKDNMWNGETCKDENNNNISGGCPNHGWDFENSDNDPSDDNGHGSHVAGTIAAVANNSTGIAGVSSKNNTKIMALKIGFNNFTVANEIKAINFAKNNGAKVINASYGSGSPSQAENDAIASFPGLFIAAAGNNTLNNDTFTDSPSGYDLPNIIAVAATDYNDGLAYFSNYGANSVDVGAPGISTFSTDYNPLTIAQENFDSLTPPNIPSGYAKTGDWGTYDLFNGAIVLYGDAVNLPYKASANSTITSPNFNLSQQNTADFAFYSRCDTQRNLEYTDYMALEVSGDGTNFTEIKKWDELDLESLYYQLTREEAGERGGPGYAGGYLRSSVPSQYLTQNFKFRFRWVTNDDNNFGDFGDGCYIDDLTLISYSPNSDAYSFKNGTSMAAPHVVGEATMIQSYNPTLSTSQVKDIILNSGDPLPSLNGKTVSGKRINLYNALVQAGQTSQPSPTPSATPIPTPIPSPTPTPTPVPTPTPSPSPSPSPVPSPTPTPSPAPSPTPTPAPQPTPTPTPTPTPIPNNPPVANNIEVSTFEDIAITFNMSATDADNDVLNYTIVSQPAHGRLEFNVGIPIPTLIYTPDTNFNGTDTFTYKANDGKLDSNTATVTFTVASVNDAPTALDGKVTTDEETPVNFNLSGTDVENNNIIYTIVSNPTKGYITYIGGTLFTYTPTKDQNAADSLNFKVNDGYLDSNIATVTFTINPVNDAPNITNINFIPKSPKTNSILFAQARADDVDGDLVTFKYQWKKNGENLKEETQASIDLSKPGNGDKGDKISAVVTVSDGQASTLSSDEVTIGNTAPVAVNDTLLTTQNNALTIKASVLALNDTDLDTKDNLAVTLVSALTHGAVTMNDGNTTFTPQLGYIGIADLIYTVSDGIEETAGSFTINIGEPLNSGKAIIAPLVNVEPEKPQIVIGNTNVDSVINVPSTVSNALLDTSNVLTTSGQTKEAAIVNNISVNTESILGTLSLAIPAGITVSGPSNWNGAITLPAILSSSSVTPPAATGTIVQTTAIVEIGASDTPLTLSKAVRLKIPGKAGQLVGFTRGSTFTAINTICAQDSQTSGDTLGEGADCKIDSGSDLVIWTKHFTKFITYTQNSNNPASAVTGAPSSSNSNSTNSSVSAPQCRDAKPGSAPTLVSALAGEYMVTLTWSKATDPVTYYLIAYGTEKGKVQFGNPNAGDKNTLSYTVKNLSAGITYYFKVRAGNNCMPGDFSNELSATPFGTLVTGLAEGFEADSIISDSTTSVVLETSENPTEGSKEANKSDNKLLFLVSLLLGMLALGLGLRKLRRNKITPTRKSSKKV